MSVRRETRRSRSIAGGHLLSAFALAFVAPASADAQDPAGAQDPALAQFEHLKEPRISERPAEKMLVVTAEGDPNIVGAAAFGLVFQLYFSIPETPKGPDFRLPRARWPESIEAPKEEWIGRYALPVPRTVTELPPHEAPEGLTASLEEWEYGEVAEILHIGPYTAETPTIERLLEFVRANGYVIEGGHEEEYVRGPTMSGPGDPERYLTIIRYRVKRS